MESWCDNCPFRGRACKGSLLPEHCPAISGGEPGGRTAPAVAPRATPDIPLAGDVVEAIARRVGADRLARWWEARTGIPCGCAGRKEALNRATGLLIRWAGLR